MPESIAHSVLPLKETDSPAKESIEGGGHVSPGMPPLRYSKRRLSLFEFWPTWLMYIPVAVQWLFFAVCYRSLTLPLIANPKLRLSGMVGVPKSELYAQAQGRCAESILTWFTHQINEQSWLVQVQSVEAQMACRALSYPVVCKPDVGCRGAGVKLIGNTRQLQCYLAAYPAGASIIIQQLASCEPEAGVFYVREPEAPQGVIISLALKYMPYVVGDGRSTLAELIANDARAGQLQHLYQARHQQRWHEVIAEGEPFRLVFAATHSKGAIFKDANHYITPALTHALNAILLDLPEFHYGRLDIKFPDIESLQAGEGIEIIEINTASSESLHIWDSDTPLSEAMRALLFQYRTLFRLGAKNRRRGFSPPGLKLLLQHWRAERRLQQFYPETD
ncbi:D-alanine--D-alanine ligase [Halioxenophilus sp. WMMB6]|uniref:D-alanine--D-alanine ligase n=1 Tax=Halioxenophilus sp. WMMB6 TaxID=3073815 RepID=UPI00295F01CC|nr:D-alanine--D-alanine ligase [Halioxenophilus sp. WMMB6]